MNEAPTIDLPRRTTGMAAQRLRPTDASAPVTLCEADLPALAEHLLRLSSDDRDLRFQGKMNEPAIQAYARQINLHRDVLCGAFCGPRLVAACHVGVYLEDGAAVGEVGVSVDAEFRGTGLGRRLVEMARKVATRHGVSRLDFVFLRGNHAMLKLARTLGAAVSFADGEWRARLDLICAPAMPRMTGVRDAAGGIEVLTTDGDPARTALLVHGAGGDPWQFRQHFVPYLRARGLRVVALSLRHHGRSARTGSTRLAQHVSDVLGVIRHVGQPQIIIGHSMGALVVQHVVPQVPVRRMVLLAPVPPDGLQGSELAQALGALKTANARDALAEALIGYKPLVARSGTSQVRVVGGLHDKVVSPDAVRRTAAFHGTRAVLLNAGHMLMSGREWQFAAQTAVNAIDVHADAACGGWPRRSTRKPAFVEDR